MEQGSFVRHRAKPEWGIGRVLLVANHYAVEFESRGLVKFAAAVADSHLEVIDQAEVPAEHPLRGGKKAGRTKQTAGVRCQHCERLLSRSVYTQDRTRKSCPRGSDTDGQFHVFYDYPDDFGLSEARANSDTPDGAQSYCKACRQGEKANNGSRCPEIR